MFVDSDNWVEPDFCWNPYHIEKDNHADMVVYNYFRRGIIRTIKREFRFSGLISREYALTKFLPYVEIYAWNKLYCKDFFLLLQYPIGRLCEDSAITHLIIKEATKIYLSDKYLYTHRKSRPGSISNGRSNQFIQDTFLYRFKRINDLKCWGYDHKDEEMRMSLLYMMICGRNNKFSASSERVLLERHFSSKTISWKYRVMLRVFRISPVIFDMVSIASRVRQKGYNAS